MKIKYTYTLLVILACLLGFSSCNNDDNPESPYVTPSEKTTVLLYAVASNNLASNLIADKNEILACADKIDFNNNNLLVYEINYSYSPALYKLEINEAGKPEYKLIKEYSSAVSSVDQKRISEVINDMQTYAKASKYGLIFWSHGTGIDYYPDMKGDKSNITTYSFGYDSDPSTYSHFEINIDKLAEAVPSSMFDFIWFDACYMAGIETIYQFRNKCNYFVAYPTEVFEWGMPYNLVMPHLLQKEIDIKGAAESFFNYYAKHSNSSARVATIVVVDMAKLEEVADLCSQAYKSQSDIVLSELQKYSRKTIGPFYDLNGYTLQKAAQLETYDTWKDQWKNALDRLLLYKAATPVDFNYNPIDLEQFCGISTHIYDNQSQTEEENFYKSLDWYKRVF